jgi:acyl carrier protein
MEGQTAAAIRQFLLNHALRDNEGVRNITTNESLIFSGLMNSLAVVDLISFIESEFAVEMMTGDVQIKDFDTIDNMCKLIRERKSKS